MMIYGDTPKRWIAKYKVQAIVFVVGFILGSFIF